MDQHNDRTNVFSDETQNNADATVRKAGDAGEDLKAIAGAASATARSATKDVGEMLEDAKSEAKSVLDERLRKLADNIARNPITSVLIAAGIGYVTAMTRRGSTHR